ncbi:hypothetical protein [Nocardiopsis metallicus]|uniref:Uncharacterized protein n=1 Tax=Nocardiopsis metallicus TaxID=179819 RepID=A0A840WJZ3_9ACTN|nr:hypothetical protein [Nocardiopsis metallicus]MBB5495803.1 hypothetical protein [Nocardiopsis metallicus]
MTTNTPSAAVPVRLIGGPDDWHGQTLSHMTATELEAPREALGSYLVSNCVPATHPDPGARAVYEPNAEPWPCTLWFFRGWVPFGPGDPEGRIATHLFDVDVVTDHEGIPLSWSEQESGEAGTVTRVLAHWEATGEDDLGADVWHVATGAGPDVVLRRYVGDLWEAGPLPTLEAPEHDDPLI